MKRHRSGLVPGKPLTKKHQAGSTESSPPDLITATAPEPIAAKEN